MNGNGKVKTRIFIRSGRAQRRALCKIPDQAWQNIDFCGAGVGDQRNFHFHSAVLGSEAKQRDVDLMIERPFRGEELLPRMKGWFTVDVNKAIDIIQQHGKLRVLDGYDLVGETRSQSELEVLSKKLTEAFGQEALLEPIAKTMLT